MPKTTSFSRVSILIPILSLTAAAQTLASKWDAVKMLASGTEIRVASGTAKPILGAVESVTDSELVVLKQRTGQQSFPRAQIMSVSVKGKDHRLRNALIGLGVGVGLGGGIGAAVGEAQAKHCQGLLCGLALPADAVVGGIAGIVGGTLTGVFWHTGGWRKIYTL